MPRAVVLLSGGIDSATLLAIALEQGFDCYALSFDYGQLHGAELVAAAGIAKKLGVHEHRVMDIPIGALGGSALTDNTIAIPDKGGVGIPVTYVPARNTVFLSLALAWAEVLDAKAIFIGVNAIDYSGYPDCRRDFIDSMEDSLSLALDSKIKIHTPLMYLTKAETWKMAKDLDCLEVIIHQTHTDYNGNRTDFNEWGYGALDNPASQLRAKGYQEAKAKGWI